MNKSEFLSMINKYLAGKTSKEEDELLFKYCNSVQQNDEWDASLLGPKEEMETRILQRLQNAIREKNGI